MIDRAAVARLAEALALWLLCAAVGGSMLRSCADEPADGRGAAER